MDGVVPIIGLSYVAGLTSGLTRYRMKQALMTSGMPA